jgi:hypothetical protein
MRMDENREHDCEIDGCHFEYGYGYTGCQHCDTWIPRPTGRDET